MIYSIARTSAVVTSGNVAADVAAGSGVKPSLMEWGTFLGAATASSFSLRRSTSLGTRTTPVALLGEDPNAPTLTGITLVDMAVAFAAEPAEATEAFRRIGLPATIGVGVIWTFPRGLQIPASGSLVLVCDATNANSHQHSAAVDV